MSGTRTIFHLSDEDEATDGAVAVLDSDSPGRSSENDTSEFGVPSGPPVSNLGAQGDPPPHRDREPDPGAAFEERSTPWFGDLDGSERERPRERPASVRRFAAGAACARGIHSRRVRRLSAFGGVGALAVLTGMIVVRSDHLSSGAPSLPASTQGARPARSAPTASLPATAARVRPPVRARSRARHVNRVPPVQRYKTPVPARVPRVSQAVVGQLVPTSAGASDAPTPSPVPAPVVAPGGPASGPVPSSSQGYAEFSFER